MSKLLAQGERILKHQRKFKDLTAAEIFLQQSVQTTLRMERWQLKTGEVTQEWGGAVRAVIGKGVGFATFTLPANGEQAFQMAVDNARAAPPTEHITLPTVKKPKAVKGIYDPKVEQYTVNDMSETLLQLGDIIHVKKMHSATMSMRANSREIAILNTNGVEQATTATKLSLSFECSAKEGDNTTNAFAETYTPNHKFSVNLEDVAKKARDDALFQLKVKQIKTAVMDVILGPYAVREIFGWVLAPALLGHNVLKKASPFVDKEGKKIASEGLSLTDRGLNPMAFYPAGFDDEGTPRRNVNVVENGILKTFLYDATSAKEAGKQSTGNSGRFSIYDRRSYVYPPSCATHDLTVHKGDTKLEEMIADVKRGIYLVYPIGAHSGNIASGSFNVAPYVCFLIEGGEVAGGVKKFLFTSTTPEVLKKINQISKKVEQTGFEWNHQMSSPHIKIEKIKIVN
ncbi:MAG: TldD/PmbA family protein [Candidatus Hodarchaeota archaeon]